ncbi:type II secretion system F family protein [Pedococcus bigeumensis]|nr:type II secretion system F family protein [Pedococcus bigeumensis]
MATRTLSAGALRIGAAGAAAALVALLMPGAASAVDPTPASISSPRFADGQLTGVLTVRAAQKAATIDGGSLSARIGTADYPVSVRPVAQTSRGAMLVVDTSGSMGASGMTTVRSAASAFLADAPADVSVGLVSFAGTAGIDVAPTKDRGRIQRAVNGLKSRGETTLYDAVALAAQGLGGFDDRSIILLSDGGDTQSKKATKAQATAALSKYGVRAEVIGFKTAESDNSVLAGFAKVGGGSVAAAGDAAAVRAAFEAAARALDSQINFTIRPAVSVRSLQTVVITGKANGAPFTVSTSVDFGAPPVAEPTTTPAPAADIDVAGPVARIAAPHGMGMTLLVGLVAIFLGVVVLAVAVLAPMFRSGRKRRVDTIERYISPNATMPAERTAQISPSSLSTSLIELGDRVMDGRESTTKTMKLIERADLPLRAGEWWVLRIVAIFVTVAAGLVLFGGGTLMNLVSGILGGAVGWFLPAFVLRFLAKRRSKKFEGQLPDVLTLVASSLATGFSLLQALDAVAKDSAEPAAKEFSRALAETRIGADVGESLERMAQRTQSENMHWAVMAIRIQREVGGNLGETLKTTAKTIREREELRRHVRGLSAEGRMSAYILIAMPIGIFFYEYYTNPSYISLLWTRSLGWVMIASGLVSLVIGVFWMRKVVDVQV